MFNLKWRKRTIFLCPESNGINPDNRDLRSCNIDATIFAASRRKKRVMVAPENGRDLYKYRLRRDSIPTIAIGRSYRVRPARTSATAF